MGNKGTLELGIFDVQNEPVGDEHTRVTFFHVPGGSKLGEPIEHSFGSSVRFTLPAFPQANRLRAVVSPRRYKEVTSETFMLTDGREVRRDLTVFRDPGEWRAEFTPWAALAGRFDGLKRVLFSSQGLTVRKGSAFDLLIEDDYDEIREKRDVLAKVALLNLYHVLGEVKEPIGGARSWFSFVNRVFQIDRERFVAQVDGGMEDLVRAIAAEIARFPDYRTALAENHFENVGRAVPAGFSVSPENMVSVKTRVERGNLQLTIAHGRDARNNRITLLDADIDENHDLLKHIADVFEHIFTGGTHPFDIHEILHLFHSQNGRSPDLGYTLV